MTKRQIIFARIILVLYLVAVAVLCFANIKNTPQIKKELFGIATDKIAHFLMFLPLPVLAFFAFDKYTEKVWTSILFTILTFGCGIGIAALTELVQSRLPYRSGDGRDFLADVIALAASSAFILILDISKQKKRL